MSTPSTGSTGPGFAERMRGHLARFWSTLAVQLGKHAGVVSLVGLIITLALGFGITQLKFATGQDSYLNTDQQVYKHAAVGLGTVDFGRFAYTAIAVSNGARAGGSYGSTHFYVPSSPGPWQDGCRTAVLEEMADFDPAQVTVSSSGVPESASRYRAEIQVTNDWQSDVVVTIWTERQEQISKRTWTIRPGQSAYLINENERRIRVNASDKIKVGDDWGRVAIGDVGQMRRGAWHVRVRDVYRMTHRPRPDAGGVRPN